MSGLSLRLGRDQAEPQLKSLIILGSIRRARFWANLTCYLVEGMMNRPGGVRRWRGQGGAGETRMQLWGNEI